MRRIFLGALAAILAMCAAGLMIVHLRPDHNLGGTMFSPPAAAERQGERMHVKQPAGSVNVNAAGIEELCGLPGIGPETARRIIEARERSGAFAYAEDLLSVKGIGEKTLQKLLPQICLE